MVIVDVMTFVYLCICGVLSLITSFFAPPEVPTLFLILAYYFMVYHIAQTVGESSGWYTGTLPNYLILLALTILVFAIIYRRYGLVVNSKHYSPDFWEALYFSVTTWTTLGYGDFAPSTRIRHITSIQAVLGYIGMGIWIALVSASINNIANSRRSVREHNASLSRANQINNTTQVLSRESDQDDSDKS